MVNTVKHYFAENNNISYYSHSSVDAQSVIFFLLVVSLNALVQTVTYNKPHLSSSDAPQIHKALR